ncbi:MAG: BatD family protein [Victivallales bacterium]|nr:BatD family protein [Victivallales bacterium]
MMKTKKYLLLLFSILTLSCYSADTEMRISISTKRPLVGEVVTLSVTADKNPRLVKMPEIPKAVWLPGYSSTSTSIVNGRASYTRTYAFRVEAKGAINIPELEIDLDGAVRKVNPFTIEAVSAGDQTVEDDAGDAIPLKDIIFGKADITNLDKEFYVGEEISLEISLFNWRQVNVQLTSYPQIKLEDIVFRDFSKQNPQNPRFVLKRESLVNIKGRSFIKQGFETAFRMLGPGEYKTRIKLDTNINIPTEQRDFFGRPTYKHTPYTVEIPFGLKVKALPKAPEGASFLGLVGNWDVNFSLKDRKYKVGDPLTLNLSVYGLGTLETLLVPGLELEGFRVYPPEIDRKTAYDGRERAEIKYVLIPLTAGEKQLEMKVSVFSTLLKKYRTFDFSQKIQVEKSDNPIANINYTRKTPELPLPVPKFEREQQAAAPSNILFLKTAPAGGVKVPLYLNWLGVYVVLLLFGPLFWLTSELNHRRREKLGSDVALRRRRDALRRKAAVLKAVRRSPDNRLDDIIQSEAVPYINDMLNLPPGTTTSELSRKVKDEILAQCLTSVGESNYMPGAVNMDKQELRNKLCKALKRLAMITFLLLMPTTSEAAVPAADKITAKPAVASEIEKKTVPESFAAAVKAYDAGDFAAAAAFFRAHIGKDSPDPALLYNLGSCLCSQGDFAGALVCFARAHLLNPDDTAITENLNFVRRRLWMPEVNKIESPTEMLMVAAASLRPDEWLLTALLAWSATGVFLAFRRRLSRNKLIIFIGASLIIILIAIIAYVFECTGDYSGRNAVVTAGDAELQSLPSMTSGSKLMRLRLGTVVKVVESRFNWVRIEADNNMKGWLQADKITRIAPGNPLPPEKSPETARIIKKP